MKPSLQGVQFSRLTRGGLVLVGVLFLVWLVLTLATGGQTRTGPASSDPTRCPNCGRPLSRQAQLAGECPYCLAERGAGIRKEKPAGPSVTRSRVIPAVLVSAFGLLLAVHVGLLIRARVGKKREELLYYTSCRKCARKLRYREHQVGHLARCPICRELVRFPEPPAGPDGAWRKVKGWWKKLQRKEQAV